MRILGLHIRETRNAGDRWSSPLEYLQPAGCEIIIGDMRSPPECNPDVVIYGGGSITASPDFRKWPSALTIAWGVGHHVRKPPWDQEMRSEHERARALCDLYFPRDTIDGFDVVPCASCLHPIFDAVLPPPVHKVVRYSAARRVEIDEPADAPHRSNEDDGGIAAAVRFLASGETVITSSYHGAYWAGLLGREVRIIPWGSKFDYLPRMTLNECRAANRIAEDEVRRWIRSSAATPP